MFNPFFESIIIQLFLLFCITFSTTYIVIDSYIFSSVRKFFIEKINNHLLNYLIGCYMCLSMWVGIILSIIDLFTKFLIVEFYYIPFVSMFFGYITATLIEKIK